ncbi:MAG TPA: HAMP domain-containing sensor histidine kinase [Vicinamibacterales bacterium]|nr:HAMP domain-containing sensor histidine kinase [Vicinamibacterales bacterium]
MLHNLIAAHRADNTGRGTASRAPESLLHPESPTTETQDQDGRSSPEEIERQGVAAHELRDQLHTAQLSWHSLKKSGAPVEGVSGQLLERALDNLTKLVERSLSEVRLFAGVNRREAIELAPFLQEIALTAQLHAESRGVAFTMDAETSGAIDGDRQLLMSAVMNVIHNAVKFTRPGGDVCLSVRMSPTHLSMAVHDQCGGLPGGDTNLFTSFTERRGADQSGLGLGLSIAKKVVESHFGTIAVRDIPGTGCVFTIELPLVPPKFRRARPRRKG